MINEYSPATKINQPSSKYNQFAVYRVIVVTHNCCDVPTKIEPFSKGHLMSFGFVLLFYDTFRTLRQHWPQTAKKVKTAHFWQMLAARGGTPARGCTSTQVQRTYSWQQHMHPHRDSEAQTPEAPTSTLVPKQTANLPVGVSYYGNEIKELVDSEPFQAYQQGDWVAEIVDWCEVNRQEFSIGPARHRIMSPLLP